MESTGVFECQCCGVCCQGEGGIFIRPEEVRAIAHFLNLSETEFRTRYTEIRHGMLSFKTDGDGFCLVHDRECHVCRIHEVKPRMCRDWPFFHGMLASRQGFEDAKDACPGICRDATWEDFLEYHRRHIGEKPPLTYIDTLRPSDD